MARRTPWACFLAASLVALVATVVVHDLWTWVLVGAVGAVALAVISVAVNRLVQSELRRAGRFDEMDAPPEMPAHQDAFAHQA